MYFLTKIKSLLIMGGKMYKILFCRIGWMEQYQGSVDDRIINGGEYNKSNVGGEAFNFASYKGKYYGYVEQGRRKTIRIERLGAVSESNVVCDIIVVFVATSQTGGQYVVGWYNHAKVYRDLKSVPKFVVQQRKSVKFDQYNLYSEEAVLIPSRERDFKVDYKSRSNIYYGNDKLNKEVGEYIKNYYKTMYFVSGLERNTEKLEGKEKEAVVKTRINQGVFRKKLLKKYKKCCLCNISTENLLIASHIKPWSECTAIEKLDENNGLLLCPNHDKLFDSNLISFESNGKIKISDKLSPDDYKDLSLAKDLSIEVTSENERYFRYHRERLNTKNIQS